MKLLFGHDKEVAHWVAERVPHLRVRIPYYPPGEVLGPAVAIGVLNGAGELIAGVIFHNYDPFVRSMELSCAATSRKWATREVVCALLRYVFSTAQCVRCSAVTPRRSTPGATSTRRFLEGLGFKREGSIRLGFLTDNAIVYGLLSEDWAAHRLNLQRRGVDGGEEVGPGRSART